jgi:chemotaxis protein CheD
VTACRAQPEGLEARADSVVYVHPGQVYVGRGDERVTTILGSCVSVCLHDAVAGIGGLNHFLLPEASHAPESSPRYARPAVDLLIDLMLREGARASRLQARVIGGARVLAAFPDTHDHLGLRNAAAAAALLAAHRIPVTGSDIGGDRGRKLVFVPRDGAHDVQLLGR